MYEEQIMRGAKWLDSRIRNWESYVDLEKLNLGLCDRCVLGQVVSPNYIYTQCRAARVPGSSRLVENGFALRRADLSTAYARFEMLTSEWKAEILRRRAIKQMMQTIADAVSRIEPEPVSA